MHLHTYNFLPFLYPASEDPSVILKIKIYISDLTWVTKKENQQQLQRNYQEMGEQAALVSMMGIFREDNSYQTLSHESNAMEQNYTNQIPSSWMLLFEWM